jgi:hypothetical protein
MQLLEIEYDSSFFDTDPYESQPGGTMTIWPFFIGRFVELPYTLPQDSTLYITRRERNIDIWIKKMDWIADQGGMALVNVHLDYIDFEADHNRNRTNHTIKRNKRWKYPLRFYKELLEHARTLGNYWHALPKDVAAWWRKRASLT